MAKKVLIVDDEEHIRSAVIQLKSETSVTSRLGFKILKKFKPERIIMP